MTIGIPRALLYYKYKDLWEPFFNELDINMLISPETNNQILERGKYLSIDESCLSMKVFMGHVDYLVGKCDYILVPRIICLKKGEKLCTNFSALYDITGNVFDTKILNYNIDVQKGETEKKAFIKMGKALGKSSKETLKAYNIAKDIYKKRNKEKYINQLRLLEESKKKKILIVSHPYNTYDKLIGETVVKHLKELNVDIIYADIFEEEMIGDKYKDISKKVYWTYNKELLESIMNYYKKIDGIILLTSFPCGPDSLVNEMCIRKLNIPLTNIIVDELSGEAGLQTRIESFIDIINEKKVHNE
jgi:predicted nucleotide-binding protein (sugar kinase/HSP70/actin superfamily)